MMPGPRVAQTKSGILCLLFLSVLATLFSSPPCSDTSSSFSNPSSQSGKLANALSTSGAKAVLWLSTVTRGLIPLKARLSDDMRSLNNSVVFPPGDFDSTATAVSSHDVSIARVTRERCLILVGKMVDDERLDVRVLRELPYVVSGWRMMSERHRDESIRSCSISLSLSIL